WLLNGNVLHRTRPGPATAAAGRRFPGPGPDCDRHHAGAGTFPGPRGPSLQARGHLVDSPGRPSPGPAGAFFFPATGPAVVRGILPAGAGLPRRAGTGDPPGIAEHSGAARTVACRQQVVAYPLRVPRAERAATSLLLLRQVEVGDGAVVDLGRHRHRLAQGRVRMDGVADVLDLAAHLDRQRRLGDQLAGVHADDPGADDPAGRLVEHQLGEALGARQADGPARRRPRELAHADLEPLGPGLGLGHADPRDLGV